MSGLGSDGLIAPRACPCCGTTGASGALLGRADGVEIIVNVCELCQAHAASFNTARLAAVIASFVLGVALAAALPVLFPWIALFSHAALSAAGAALPLGLGYALSKRPAPPHAARGRGVWWSDRFLVAANAAWAVELAELNRAQAEPADVQEPWMSAWMLAGLFFTAGALGLFHWLHHPLLRVVNLTAGGVEVSVDGRLAIFLEPTSGESPAAGVELRVPSGTRELVVRSAADGRLLSRQTARFEGGREHLFAPGSDGYCFWLESTGYGRARTERALRQPLEGEEKFWILPRGVDTWFAPNPPAGEQSVRASGGVLTALRQAPCAEAFGR